MNKLKKGESTIIYIIERHYLKKYSTHELVKRIIKSHINQFNLSKDSFISD